MAFMHFSCGWCLDAIHCATLLRGVEILLLILETILRCKHMLMSLYLWFMCVIPATYPSSLYVYVSRVYICLSVVSLYLIACYAPGWPSTALLPALVIIPYKSSAWHLSGDIWFSLVSCCICIHYILCLVLHRSITLFQYVSFKSTPRESWLNYKLINFCYSLIIR